MTNNINKKFLLKGAAVIAASFSLLSCDTVSNGSLMKHDASDDKNDLAKNQELDAILECGICYNISTDAQNLKHSILNNPQIEDNKCNKIYCSGCINAWIIQKQSYECPFCRQCFSKAVPVNFLPSLKEKSINRAKFYLESMDKQTEKDYLEENLYNIFKLFSFYHHQEARAALGDLVFKGLNIFLKTKSLQHFKNTFLFSQKTIKPQHLSSTNVRRIETNINKSLYELMAEKHECSCLQKHINEKCKQEESCSRHNGEIISLKETFLLSMLYNLLAEIDELKSKKMDTTQKVDELTLDNFYNCFKTIELFTHLKESYVLSLSEDIKKYISEDTKKQIRDTMERVADYYRGIQDKQSFYFQFFANDQNSIEKFVVFLGFMSEKALNLASILPSSLKKEFIQSDNPLIGYMVAPVQALSTVFIFNDLHEYKFYNRSLIKTIVYSRQSLAHIAECKDVLAEDFIWMHEFNLYLLNIKASQLKNRVAHYDEYNGNNNTFSDRSSDSDENNCSFNGYNKNFVYESKKYLDNVFLRGDAYTYIAAMCRSSVIEYDNYNEIEIKRLKYILGLQCDLFKLLVAVFPAEFPLILRYVEIILDEINNDTVDFENVGVNAAILKNTFYDLREALKNIKQNLFFNTKVDKPANKKRCNSYS